jgi:Ca2+/Na+ antiporter
MRSPLPGELHGEPLVPRSPGRIAHMFLTLVQFFLAAGIIYWSCEYFVNGIEWCGRRLNLGATAVGSVLAAFGTALQESAVTFTAVVFGRTPADRDLGVGDWNRTAAFFQSLAVAALLPWHGTRGDAHRLAS